MNEPLTPGERDARRAALHDLLADLERQLEASREGARPVDLDEPIGRLTRMDAIQQQKMTEANRRDIELRCKQIRAALSRLDAGEYGDCLQCDEPIGSARLEARPEATLCVDCQSRRER